MSYTWIPDFSPRLNNKPKFYKWQGWALLTLEEQIRCMLLLCAATLKSEFDSTQGITFFLVLLITVSLGQVLKLAGLGGLLHWKHKLDAYALLCVTM